MFSFLDANRLLKIQGLPQFIDGFDSDFAHWDTHVKRAAVAVLFVLSDQDEPANLVLTRRTTTVSTHRGQIGFAGGRADIDDTRPTDTAIRETEEELGIPRNQLMPHGQLNPIRSIDGSEIIPVVITTTVQPTDFKLSTREVAATIITPWHQFKAAEARSITFCMFGKSRQSWLYNIDKKRVWGMTASILHTANLR